jgi:hypothetical protein
MQQIYIQKWKNFGYNVELITEFAKDCVYEKQFDLLNNDQLFVLAHQNRRLQRIEESNETVDYIISDSPLLLSGIYANEHNYSRNFISFQNLVLDLFSSYNNINLFLNRASLTNYDSNGRLEDEYQAVLLDTKIKKILDFWKLDYTFINDREITKETIEKIIEDK